MSGQSSGADLIVGRPADILLLKSSLLDTPKDSYEEYSDEGYTESYNMNYQYKDVNYIDAMNFHKLAIEFDVDFSSNWYMENNANQSYTYSSTDMSEFGVYTIQNYVSLTKLFKWPLSLLSAEKRQEVGTQLMNFIDQKYTIYGGERHGYISVDGSYIRIDIYNGGHLNRNVDSRVTIGWEILNTQDNDYDSIECSNSGNFTVTFSAIDVTETYYDYLYSDYGTGPPSITEGNYTQFHQGYPQKLEAYIDLSEIDNMPLIIYKAYMYYVMSEYNETNEDRLQFNMGPAKSRCPLDFCGNLTVKAALTNEYVYEVGSPPDYEYSYSLDTYKYKGVRLGDFIRSSGFVEPGISSVDSFYSIDKASLIRKDPNQADRLAYDDPSLSDEDRFCKHLTKGMYYMEGYYTALEEPYNTSEVYDTIKDEFYTSYEADYMGIYSVYDGIDIGSSGYTYTFHQDTYIGLTASKFLADLNIDYDGLRSSATEEELILKLFG